MSDFRDEVEALKPFVRMRRMIEHYQEVQGVAEAEIGTGQASPASTVHKTVRRPPGRPGWTAEAFHAAYRKARDRCKPGAPDKEIAYEMGYDGLQMFQRLVRRFGRPA